jgi:hypothetical protein
VRDDATDDAVSISYDADAGAYLARFDDDVLAPSMAIVEAMAAVLDVDPMELDPLVDTVDPMAIDRLADAADGDDDLLEFQYVDHVVAVYGHGVVEISPPSDGD